ncbi:MAG TPA: DegV family protein [Candidatus Scatomorpha stercorigallinarum]|nr:DegV family protein [Candidatus Scatomorpha stercorigallinarum]
MVKIITDSTADFTAAEAAGLGIDIVHLRTRFGDEEYIDGVDITPHQFYEKLVESDVLPTTSQPSPAEFEAAFASALEEAGEVVAITISSALSGTYQSAVIAAETFGDRVRVVDSLSASIGEQVIVRRAAQLAAEGLSAAELAGRIEAERGDVCVLALLDTLEYLKRGGRISAAAAFAGGVLSIKPVVTLRDGAVALVGKARGSKNGGNLLNQLVEKHGIDFSMPYLLGYTGLSDALLTKYAADHAELWRAHAEELPVTAIGSVIGTHGGPGAIAVAFFGLK